MTLTPDDYRELADGYLAELEAAKEASGYNAYLAEHGDTIHWTFSAYLIHLRSIKAKHSMQQAFRPHPEPVTQAE
jgi:hypothetical protein